MILEDFFIGFIECDCGFTGRAIADSTLGLDPANLCGQAYDGAGSVNLALRSLWTETSVQNEYYDWGCE